MNELNEKMWSLISERGAEASGLTYAAARNLEGELLDEKIRGCMIVTDDAAARIRDDKAKMEMNPPR